MYQRHLRFMLVSFALVLFAGAAWAGQLVVDTGGDHHAIGEFFQITITNPTTEVISLESSPWFGIIHDDTQICVYGCMGLPVIESIGPGEVHVFTHYTLDYPDPIGMYTVVVFEMGTGGEGNPMPSTHYLLDDPIANESLTWGAVKSLY